MRKFDDFDQYASEYRNIHDISIKVSGADSDYFSRYKIIKLQEHENSSSNLKILDFGCGDGNSCKYIRKYFPNSTIHGIDPSQESIERAKDLKISNSFFDVFDGLKIPDSMGDYDLIFSSMVFHHIAHELHGSLLQQIYDSLKLGGRFYLFEHNPLNPITRKIVRECPFDEDAVLLKPSYCRQLLNGSNFRFEKLRYILFFPRHALFNPFHGLESFLTWLPIGAQYYTRAEK